MYRNNFRINPNNLRGSRNFSDSLLFSNNSDDTEQNLQCHQLLKCVTLRVGNTPDMDETPLRPMIISRTWMPIMTPVYSTKQLFGEP